MTFDPLRNKNDSIVGWVGCDLPSSELPFNLDSIQSYSKLHQTNHFQFRSREERERERANFPIQEKKKIETNKIGKKSKVKNEEKKTRDKKHKKKDLTKKKIKYNNKR